MEEVPLFPREEESLWLLPERRGSAAASALAAWERGEFGPLLEGFSVYLRRLEGKTDLTALTHVSQARRFLRFLSGLSRKPLRWERGDFLRFRDELRAEGAEDATLLRYFYGMRAFLRFLEWAGLSPPPLDLDRPLAVLRKARVLSPEEYRGLVKEAEGLPSRWRYTYLALLVLLGEAGLRLSEAMALTVDEVRIEGGRARVRLPGGFADLSPTGTKALEAYLAWRKKVALPGLPNLLLSPRGKPLTPANLRDLRRALREHLERDLDAHSLRLTGQARLVREHGPKRARALLRRAGL